MSQFLSFSGSMVFPVFDLFSVEKLFCDVRNNFHLSHFFILPSFMGRQIDGILDVIIILFFPVTKQLIVTQ